MYKNMSVLVVAKTDFLSVSAQVALYCNPATRRLGFWKIGGDELENLVSSGFLSVRFGQRVSVLILWYYWSEYSGVLRFHDGRWLVLDVT